MRDTQSYKVLQPVHLTGHGTLEPGATVALHPRQAMFLLTAGVLGSEDSGRRTQDSKRSRTKKEAKT